MQKHVQSVRVWSDQDEGLRVQEGKVVRLKQSRSRFWLWSTLLLTNSTLVARSMLLVYCSLLEKQKYEFGDLINKMREEANAL